MGPGARRRTSPSLLTQHLLPQGFWSFQPHRASAATRLLAPAAPAVVTLQDFNSGVSPGGGSAGRRRDESVPSLLRAVADGRGGSRQGRAWTSGSAHGRGAGHSPLCNSLRTRGIILSLLVCGDRAAAPTKDASPSPLPAWLGGALSAGSIKPVLQHCSPSSLHQAPQGCSHGAARAHPKLGW